MADLYADIPFVLYFSLNAMADYSSGRRRRRIYDTARVCPFAVESDLCRCAASFLHVDTAYKVIRNITTSSSGCPLYPNLHLYRFTNVRLINKCSLFLAYIDVMGM